MKIYYLPLLDSVIEKENSKRTVLEGAVVVRHTFERSECAEQGKYTCLREINYVHTSSNMQRGAGLNSSSARIRKSASRDLCPPLSFDKDCFQTLPNATQTSRPSKKLPPSGGSSFAIVPSNNVEIIFSFLQAISLEKKGPLLNGKKKLRDDMQNENAIYVQ